jgi:hypothetical protein
MRDKPDDTPTLGEQMNRGMYLDPGFTPDKPSLVNAIPPRKSYPTNRSAAIISATLHACAIVPHGACGALPSKISPNVPMP